MPTLSPTSTILAVGLLLGAAQFALGLWIGLRLAGRKQHEGPTPLDPVRATRLAADLHRITSTVSSSVREHGRQIDQADRRLREEAANNTEPLTGLVAGVVRQMLSANERLRRELSESERLLEEQALEMQEHVAMALTDPLTELPNRRAFDDHYRSLMSAWRKHRTEFSLAIFDVDHFKKVNDTHGHEAGDRVLKTVAQSLRLALRKYDIVARYGGEEFVVLFPNTSLPDAVTAVRKALETVAANEPVLDSGPLAVTASVGLASVEVGEGAKQLLVRADEALYAAKRGGRDCGYLHDGRVTQPIGKGVLPTEEGIGSNFDQPEDPAGAPNTTEAGGGRPDTTEQTLAGPEGELADEVAAACREVRDSLDRLARGGAPAAAGAQGPAV